MSLPLRRLSLLSALAAYAAPAQTPMLTLQGVFPSGQLGGIVAPAGDVDGDGFGDVIASALYASTNAPLSGWSAVYSGRTGAPIHVLPGRAPVQHFGGGAAGIGDIDGDGCDDFAIGALNDGTAGSHAGRVWVFSGRTATTIYDIPADGPGDIFGNAIDAAGDVDADGVPDFIVGAPENGDPIPNYGAGYAKVFSGRTGAVLHHFTGRSIGFEHGHAVAGVGDVDGDGHADVAVAAVLDDIGPGVGAAFVYSGRTGALLHTLRGAPRVDHFGVSLAGVGDVDGDGVPDIGVGCVELTSGVPGHVSIFSGRTGARVRYVAGSAPSDMFGMSVCAVGDLDRDGFADFATGAPGARNSFGAAYVYRGRDGSLLRTIVGKTRGGAFTFPMAAADINRDGYVDLVIGERGAAQSLGRVYVVSGVNATALGIGCADYAPAPHLSATTPRVGTNWSHFTAGAAPNTAAVLFASPVPATPMLLGRSGCTYYLDPAVTFVLGTLQTDGSGTALHQFVLPPNPTLVGLALATQVAMPARTLPLSFTNGIAATIAP